MNIIIIRIRVVLFIMRCISMYVFKFVVDLFKSLVKVKVNIE